MFDCLLIGNVLLVCVFLSEGFIYILTNDLQYV